MASISVRSVRKKFGDVEVIHGLDLEIPAGQMTVLLGPSGCGKSTLLRMIAGLEQVSSGDVVIDGHRSNDTSPKDRGCAMVFQSYALYPHLTVHKNLAFPLTMAGWKASVIDDRVRSVAKMLDIEPYLQRYPRELSGGQRQRVAMGRAIIREPKVYLFDEPLSNLDAELRVRMRLEINQLQRSLNATMVFVTHDQVEAMTLAHQIVVMRNGLIEQVASPLDIYQSPRTRFVAAFIGSPSMNFFEVQAVRKDGQAQRIELKGGHSVTFAGKLDSKPHEIGIRPEHLRVGGSKESAFLSFEREKIQLVGIEHLGDRSYCYVKAPVGELAFQTLPQFTLSDGPLNIEADNKDLHFFDSQGQAIVTLGHAM